MSGSVSVAAAEGQWLFGLALVKEAVTWPTDWATDVAVQLRER
jgi:hypothetical protein